MPTPADWMPRRAESGWPKALSIAQPHEHVARCGSCGLNLFNNDASDLQYFYASRLQGEPAAGVDDIHFHLIEPRQVRVSLEWGL